MANRFTNALLAIEALAIAGGLAAATAIVVKGYVDQPPHGHDEAVAAVAARSACTGDTGRLGTLRAWLDGAELPAEPTAREPTVDDAMRARGAALFVAHCATCHDIRGDGTGPTAILLRHPPANFTIGTYELRTTEHEALPADIDLFRTITRGVHGTAMPPWLALPERDRWALAAHLKTLSKQFAEDVAPAPVDLRTPSVTPDRIAAGRRTYASAGCASCHGATGRGDGPAATALFYKSGASARPRDLRIGRFHRGTRLSEIYLTIVTGLDGTPMASFAKVLPPEDLWDVAMYVQTLTPPVTELASGIRCPELPADVRCVVLPAVTDCVPASVDPDELVGVRMQLRSLPATD